MKLSVAGTWKINPISQVVATGGMVLGAVWAGVGAAAAASGPCRGCGVQIVSYRTIAGDTIERKRFPGRRYGARVGALAGDLASAEGTLVLDSVILTE